MPQSIQDWLLEEAALAYDAAALKYYGSYVHFNLGHPTESLEEIRAKFAYRMSGRKKSKGDQAAIPGVNALIELISP